MKKSYFTGVITGGICTIVILIGLGILAVIVSNRSQDKKREMISKLPEELRLFPFPDEAINSIKLEDNYVLIEGYIHRERNTTVVVESYYNSINLKGWSYDFHISNYPVTDGSFKLEFRQVDSFSLNL